ncbi:XRE family transcriptional regulator [Streptacidiphilus sp. PB12-B1b]|uniref:helix-turn-helix domain-containing protein n=1 Tax=Streptacidiphilus sp. PB12-B1b TaxID=2705012 RepID=UPI0015F9AB1D|nr:helix-turn-helix domain-containing protein [Streptacidiphilus sp. PB12-B1b]QMU77041.1 XRE family transcriptional regulator [Streptacidiphilus sp. PB12-B1b]
MRLQRGLTQEELSEHSGISVRTIRNLERGQIARPRRSSVDMLLAVLDPELRPDQRATLVDELGVPSALDPEWTQPTGRGAGVWRGSRPPRTSLIGREHEVEQLGGLVMANQVVVVTGPGGVGKSRVALAVAESVGHRLADGVAVVEMGRIPTEQHLDSESATELALKAVGGLLENGPGPAGGRLLLVLDNAEHLPRTTALLVERLLSDYRAVHLLITSRRPPKLHGAGIWELAPLSCEAAVELMVQRLRTSCPTLDLSEDLSQVAELCRQLDGLPRLVEFAAHRLRLVSLATLLSDSRAKNLLGSSDLAALPHQRTLEASVRWSLELLDERHQSFLSRLARRPEGIRLDADDEAAGAGAAGLSSTEVELLADLADSSLLQVDRGRQYQYRLLRHVQALLAAGPEPVLVGAGREEHRVPAG